VAAAQQQTFLLIGNYPPPVCGWGMQTKLVADELRRRGYRCDVLKLNENRNVKSPAYIDVQGAIDYARKLYCHVRKNSRVNVDLNGKSLKGYALALAAVLLANLKGERSSLIFRGGIPQRYFPGRRRSPFFWAYRFLFRSATAIACDNDEIANAIAAYGVPRRKISAITPFSRQYVALERCELDAEAQAFFEGHDPVWLSYVCYRDEYALPVLRRCMELYRAQYPRAGFIWVGFPANELTNAHNYVGTWPAHERNGLLLRGNVDHGVFLTLMARCSGYVRTPACDGVAASVLEALSLQKPVLASENGRRPAGVVTYPQQDPGAMCARLAYVTEHRDRIVRDLGRPETTDNIGRMADWLTGEK
jgi:hypothetical protein